jgi:putative transposase
LPFRATLLETTGKDASMTYNDLLKGRYSETGQEYLITTVTHQRRPVFRHLYAARLLIHEMKRLEFENMATWLTWVIMPNHLHGLISLSNHQSLPDIMNTLKGRSAYSINKLLNLGGAFWQNGYHDHALRMEEDRVAISRYIVANPLRARLVDNIGSYPHWDSIWLE